MTDLFDFGVTWEEPSTWDFDFTLWYHWLEDSYHTLGRDWKEGEECESKEVLVLMAGPSIDPYLDSWDESCAVALWYGEIWDTLILEVTDLERCGCWYTEGCQSL